MQLQRKSSSNFELDVRFYLEMIDELGRDWELCSSQLVHNQSCCPCAHEGMEAGEDCVIIELLEILYTCNKVHPLPHVDNILALDLASGWRNSGDD